MIFVSVSRLVAIFFLAMTTFQSGYANEICTPANNEKSVFSSELITDVGIRDRRFNSLNRIEKKHLFSARRTLIFFLKATQIPDADLERFLSKNLREKYKTRNQLIDAFLEPETTIELTRVTGFEHKNQSSFKINYYVVIFAEGNFFLHEDVAVLVKAGDSWKIASIGELK